MNEDYKYNEEWVLIVGDIDWVLNKKEAIILKDAIKQGNRGMVVFDELVVNIPFIKEFYLSRRFLKPEYQITAPVYDEPILSPEEQKKADEKREKQWAEYKKKAELLNKQIKEKTKLSPRLTPTQFEKRRKELLEQAKTL